MAKICMTLVCMVFSWSAIGQGPAPYIAQNGTVHFSSDAPLELIEASSDELRGALDPVKNTFAFRVDINSFKGFNSPLQQVHFNENFMESSRYGPATFIGKIIEKVDLGKEGQYYIRAKGELDMHGIKRERIIKCCVKVKDGKMLVHARFTILLEEHDIDVPRIVHQKIATEIIVDINAELIKPQQ